MSFVDGDLWERSFETANGVVDVLAEVVLDGRRVELRDMAVYPRAQPRLSVPVAEVARWLRAVAAEAREAGFDELRITGIRMSGATPGRRVDLTIPSREGPTMSGPMESSHAAEAEKDWDAVLARLRADGFSPVESIKVTRAVLDVSLGEAKRIVHESAAWADARASFEELQESVLSHARSVTG